MKRILLVVFAAILLGWGESAFTNAFAEEKPQVAFMVVQVESAGIRDKPYVVSSIIATTRYGVVLKVFEIRDGWAKVEIPGQTRIGFVFATSLRKVTIPEGQIAEPLHGVTAPQVVLAGKGFAPMNSNPLTSLESRENSTQKQWLDQMESLTIDPSDALAFVLGKAD
ncbi:MAG: hypothetical protein LWX00_05680 [Spirochaetia bacterium]|nr:hypothetical protein [Spirochaetia bacterium]